MVGRDCLGLGSDRGREGGTRSIALSDKQRDKEIEARNRVNCQIELMTARLLPIS